jgi:hypothetical protein
VIRCSSIDCKVWSIASTVIEKWVCRRRCHLEVYLQEAWIRFLDQCSKVMRCVEEKCESCGLADIGSVQNLSHLHLRSPGHWPSILPFYQDAWCNGSRASWDRIQTIRSSRYLGVRIEKPNSLAPHPASSDINRALEYTALRAKL